MECDGRSADYGVLFVNVSCATGAKQITIGQDIPTELYISRIAISLALPTDRFHHDTRSETPYLDFPSVPSTCP